MHSRRAFLRVALGLTGVTSVLAACTPAAPTAAPPTAAAPPQPTPASTPAAAAPKPTATSLTNAPAAGSTGTPAAATAGKLPSPMVGVPDGYTTLPTLAKSYDGVPGRG